MNAEEQRDTDINETIESLMKGSLFPREAEKSIISICDRYARQKCKEQRVLCADRFDRFKDSDLPIQSKILTAPEPPMNDIKPPVNKPE